MHDSQIVVPDSFIQLFSRPGQPRPDALPEHIALRYEICDDMAAMLCDDAKDAQWRLGITEANVLDKMFDGLTSPASGPVPLTEPEARWVTCRLAELLGWTDHLARSQRL